MREARSSSRADRYPYAMRPAVKDGPAPATGRRDRVHRADRKERDRIQETIAVASRRAQPCRILINIGRAGILADGEPWTTAGPMSARRATPSRRTATPSPASRRESRDVAGANDSKS